MSEFRMPSLGADMEEGKVVEWRVKPGDEVHKGDIILAVETSKGILDVEVFEDGVIDSIEVGTGETVPVDTVLAVISGKG